MGQPGQTADVIDAFGTLSASEHGISRFFGPTGGSEVRPYYYTCIFFGSHLIAESALSTFPLCPIHRIQTLNLPTGQPRVELSGLLTYARFTL